MNKNNANPAAPKTLTALAAALGISRAGIYLLRKEPNAPKNKDLVEWEKFLHTRKAETRGRPTIGDAHPTDATMAELRKALLTAQERKEHYSWKLKELEALKASGELLPADQVGEIVQTAFVVLGTHVRNLPPTVAPLCHSPAAARDALERWQRERFWPDFARALNEVSNKYGLGDVADVADETSPNPPAT